ncbi:MULTISPECIES: exopolysaccharide production repressor protein [unclassified Sinorhizobium]|uniref:exopolysaccharide production repressor protein n=1 Tax=unclassified Sinorhizobium TaxID=2613772 RepID=UPI0024C23695|nr:MULTISPECIES: exopolysaccharide production repressor protein [unclassified Sinorhizobium]MDK1374658.1 exopolysaccharide production repressor protein [Sinorhizobium sp. 6-70]MDK1480732.1 exopolysaccharide production repressor protein [Sinorhizobium sp. 6-117]
MFAPRVLASMIGALVAFAIATYLLNGSLVSTAIQTLLCAVLLQVGYFIAVVFLVWKEASGRRKLSPGKVSMESTSDDKQSGKVSIGPLNRPGHSNP